MHQLSLDARPRTADVPDAPEGIRTALHVVSSSAESDSGEGSPKGSASLGRFTKFADTFPGVNPETGEIIEEKQPLEYDSQAAELERWLLLSGARKLLMKIEEREKRRRVPFSEVAFYTRLTSFGPIVVVARGRDRFTIETDVVKVEQSVHGRDLLNPPGDYIPQTKQAAKFRVINCCRSKIGKDVQPEVWATATRASFHKVGVCGSVWTCAICSRRINQARQRHVAAAYNLFVSSKAELYPGVRNGDAMLVTFTIRHGAGDDLQSLLDRLKEANRSHLQKSYAYKKLVGYTRTVNKERLRVASPLDFVGRISATEMTYGDNGWHPHLHEIWFFDRRLRKGEIDALRLQLAHEWHNACLAAGLPAPNLEIGVDVRRALSAEEYLTKFDRERHWAPEKELASSHVKKSRKGGKAPFALLWEYIQGDKRSGALFYQYAEATLGRHQLEFSKNLRSRLVELGIKDLLKADEELAAELAEQSTMLGVLTDRDFDALCRADDYGIDAHGTLLFLCIEKGFDAALSFLRSLPSYMPGAVVQSGAFESQFAPFTPIEWVWPFPEAAGQVEPPYEAPIHYPYRIYPPAPERGQAPMF